MQQTQEKHAVNNQEAAAAGKRFKVASLAFLPPDLLADARRLISPSVWDGLLHSKVDSAGLMSYSATREQIDLALLVSASVVRNAEKSSAELAAMTDEQLMVDYALAIQERDAVLARNSEVEEQRDALLESARTLGTKYQVTLAELETAKKRIVELEAQLAQFPNLVHQQKLAESRRRVTATILETVSHKIQ
jgi:hypothetical protein